MNHNRHQAHHLLWEKDIMISLACNLISQGPKAKMSFMSMNNTTLYTKSCRRNPKKKGDPMCNPLDAISTQDVINLICLTSYLHDTSLHPLCSTCLWRKRSNTLQHALILSSYQVGKKQQTIISTNGKCKIVGWFLAWIFKKIYDFSGGQQKNQKQKQKQIGQNRGRNQRFWETTPIKIAHTERKWI